MKQDSFSTYFSEANHNDEEDWEMRLIQQTHIVGDLRKNGILLATRAGNFSFKWIE